MTEQEWLLSARTQELLDHDAQHGYKASDRKLRLFGCACAREILHLLPDERSVLVIEAAEILADGGLSEEERRLFFDMHSQVYDRLANKKLFNHKLFQAWLTVERAMSNERWDGHFISRETIVQAHATREITHEKMSHIVREIALNPWGYWKHKIRSNGKQECFIEPITKPTIGERYDPIPKIVLEAATAIYNERAFADMPILADLLEDAGCTSEEILQHCRGYATLTVDRCQKARVLGRHQWNNNHCLNCDLMRWQPLGCSHYRGCWVLDLLLGKR